MNSWLSSFYLLFVCPHKSNVIWKTVQEPRLIQLMCPRSSLFPRVTTAWSCLYPTSTLPELCCSAHLFTWLSACLDFTITCFWPQTGVIPRLCKSPNLSWTLCRVLTVINGLWNWICLLRTLWTLKEQDRCETSLLTTLTSFIKEESSLSLKARFNQK